MEKNMDNEMEAGIIGIGVSKSSKELRRGHGTAFFGEQGLIA